MASAVVLPKVLQHCVRCYDFKDPGHMGKCECGMRTCDATYVCKDHLQKCSTCTRLILDGHGWSCNIRANCKNIRLCANCARSCTSCSCICCRRCSIRVVMAKNDNETFCCRNCFFVPSNKESDDAVRRFVQRCPDNEENSKS